MVISVVNLKQVKESGRSLFQRCYPISKYWLNPPQPPISHYILLLGEYLNPGFFRMLKKASRYATILDDNV